MEHLYATGCKVLTNRLAALRQRTLLRTPLRSRIAMFHDICLDGQTPSDDYACPLGGLQNCVDRHLNGGWRATALDELLGLPYREAKQGRFVLTFDDGYASVATLAAPYLAARGVPFAIFPITEKIGEAGYLTAQQLRELAAEPLCTIGSHTVTHPMLRFLPRDRALAELADSKKMLEDLLGRPVEHLAFPYGSAYAVCARDLRLAAGCGYRSALLTTATAYSRFPAGNYSLPRLDRPDVQDKMQK